MKILFYLLTLLSPVIYVSPWFQSLPPVFRGYLPAVAIVLLFKRKRTWSIVFAAISALLMDTLVSPGIGAYVILHALIIASLYLCAMWMPKPSAVGLSITCLVLGCILELLFFILLTILGWDVQRLKWDLFFLIPLSTAIYTWIVGHIVLKPMDDYTAFGRDNDE
ncbi:MAG: hypothetical protein SPI65_00630 [Peptoniphilus sp.]|nr:hypothetical protein [Peptoniphilus sp.]MDD7363680.1 hypothetical protein [Bacillota bacterium]MDY6044065.1 hypothetical protein [Peptoniphilus sp.]